MHVFFCDDFKKYAAMRNVTHIDSSFFGGIKTGFIFSTVHKIRRSGENNNNDNKEGKENAIYAGNINKRYRLTFV